MFDKEKNINCMLTPLVCHCLEELIYMPNKTFHIKRKWLPKSHKSVLSLLYMSEALLSWYICGIAMWYISGIAVWYISGIAMEYVSGIVMWYVSVIAMWHVSGIAMEYIFGIAMGHIFI